MWNGLRKRETNKTLNHSSRQLSCIQFDSNIATLNGNFRGQKYDLITWESVLGLRSTYGQKIYAFRCCFFGYGFIILGTHSFSSFSTTIVHSPRSRPANDRVHICKCATHCFEKHERLIFTHTYTSYATNTTYINKNKKSKYLPSGSTR